MKFSILLPTRNRLKYLKYAVESVLRQSVDDWEIIISDNNSSEDIQGYVNEVNDVRVKYIHTESTLPVTDNWNLALSKSKGDFVVMLGDDDCLAPKFFEDFNSLLHDYPDPDFVYCSGYFFAYPGVFPEEPDGFARTVGDRLHTGQNYWLDSKAAKEITRKYLSFEMAVPSNMQFSIVSRRAINTLLTAGAFYQSPFPDFYATPALFWTSERILIWSQPKVIVGITPKSYGFTHFNHDVLSGTALLHNDSLLSNSAFLRENRLLGTSYNDSWLMAMERLEQNFTGASGDFLSLHRYRRLQIAYCFKRYYLDNTLSWNDFKRHLSELTIIERIWYGSTLPILLSSLRFFPSKFVKFIVERLRDLVGQHALGMEKLSIGSLSNILDLFNLLEQDMKRI